jgi:hypothetical protein
LQKNWTLWENQCIKDLCNLVKVYDYPHLKITQAKFTPWRMSSISLTPSFEFWCRLYYIQHSTLS